MGYPFHGKATNTTSALCAYCRTRVTELNIVYRKASDKGYLDQGHFGIQRQGDKGLVENRVFETYCSKACAKVHIQHTVTYFELIQEQGSICTNGHVLLPETVYYYWRKGRCLVKCKLCVQLANARHHAQSGRYTQDAS